MSGPHVGDYVGLHANTGDWLYVCAVNRTTREVRIGAVCTAGGGWLSEAAAQALYSYSWGAKKALPGPATVASWYSLPKHQVWPGYDLDSIPPTLPSVHTTRCECGAGSDELSGAHSHWCPRWLAPERKP